MKKVISSAIILAFLLIVISLAVFYFLLQPISPSTSSDQDFVVARGDGMALVAKNLQDQGLIKNARAWRLLAKLKGESGLRPGIFVLNKNMSGEEILQYLKTSPKELTITILPGWRREEIAEYLSSLRLINFSASDFTAQTATLEGQLMAETYRIFPTAETNEIINLLHRQYQKDIVENTQVQTLLKNSGHSWSEILILASILQREARDEEQMRHIAGIIYRRLADNYPLQLCATAQYASGKDKQTGKWWEEPTLAETQFDSVYNTYRYQGLPPAPIAAVSLKAVKAALDPLENDYYFYLHDASGQIHYAKTLEEHNLNKEKYL